MMSRASGYASDRGSRPEASASMMSASKMANHSWSGIKCACAAGSLFDPRCLRRRSSRSSCEPPPSRPNDPDQRPAVRRVRCIASLATVSSDHVLDAAVLGNAISVMTSRSRMLNSSSS